MGPSSAFVMMSWLHAYVQIQENCQDVSRGKTFQSLSVERLDISELSHQ